MAVPTIEEFFDMKAKEQTQFNDFLSFMYHTSYALTKIYIIQWAKEHECLHVQEALKRASEGATVINQPCALGEVVIINKQSILGAYGKEEIG